MRPWTVALGPSYCMPHLQGQPTPVSSTHTHTAKEASRDLSNFTANVTIKLPQRM